MKSSTLTKKKPPKAIWALFDEHGIWAGTYKTKEEAVLDAYGPRFRDHSIREYALMPKSKKAAK